MADIPYQEMARTIDRILNGEQRPKQFGFALFIFEFGKTEGGRVNYVSNADRPEMLVAVREWLARAEGRTLRSGVIGKGEVRTPGADQNTATTIECGSDLYAALLAHPANALRRA